MKEWLQKIRKKETKPRQSPQDVLADTALGNAEEFCDKFNIGDIFVFDKKRELALFTTYLARYSLSERIHNTNFLLNLAEFSILKGSSLARYFANFLGTINEVRKKAAESLREKAEIQAAELSEKQAKNPGAQFLSSTQIEGMANIISIVVSDPNRSKSLRKCIQEIKERYRVIKP